MGSRDVEQVSVPDLTKVRAEAQLATARVFLI